MNTSSSSIREALYLVLHQVPQGRFTTYGRLAALLPQKATARQVARLLSQLPEGSQLPWHRVVNRQFRISEFANAGEQLQRLIGEGVLVSDSGRLPKALLWPDTAPLPDTDRPPI